MKNKILKISGLMILMISLGGFWGYNEYLKPNTQVQEQLNNQFGSDFFNSFDTQGVLSNSNSANKEQLSAASSDEKHNGSNENTPKSAIEQEKSMAEMQASGGRESSSEERLTIEEIDKKYSSQFSYLQNIALSRLDTLFSAAVQEYVQGKKSGTLNRSTLAQKYIQAGTMLEGSVDKQFNNTLNAMQADLVANNLPTDIIGVKKSEYERAKAAKRSQLLAKASK